MSERDSAYSLCPEPIGISPPYSTPSAAASASIPGRRPPNPLSSPPPSPPLISWRGCSHARLLSAQGTTKPSACGSSNPEGVRGLPPCAHSHAVPQPYHEKVRPTQAIGEQDERETSNRSAYIIPGIDFWSASDRRWMGLNPQQHRPPKRRQRRRRCCIRI